MAKLDIERWRADPAGFIEAFFVNPDNGEPYRLYPAEREFLDYALRLDPSGRLLYETLLFAAIKKSGKTEFGALFVLMLLVLFCGRNDECFVVANDFEQAQSRVFARCCLICRASPLLRDEVDITAKRILFRSSNATLTVLAGDYTSAAGAHPTCVVCDELWGFVSERSRRLYDELQPVPSRRISCRLIVTHAGFSGESELLEELYKRGLQLPLVGTDLYAGDGLLMHWSHTPISPMFGGDWLEKARRENRPAQYLRMWENRWVTSEQAFIPMASWDRITQPQIRPLREDMSTIVYCGIDASVKHDSTAIACVMYDREAQQVRLVRHMIYQPTPDEPVDFEQVIEANMLDIKRRFWIGKVLCDPYQMVSTMQRLQRMGIRIEEFPQSPPNLTEIAQNLYDLIVTDGLVLYPDPAMRKAASQTVAIEGPRGWRLSKDKQSARIDIIIALAMAAFAAVKASHENAPLPYAAANGAVDGVNTEEEYSRSWRMARYSWYLSSGGQLPPF